MLIELIPQVEIGGCNRIRVGDVLNATIADSFCKRFRFAVAYMRISGLTRLANSIDSLLNRHGSISGAVGIDDAITSVEALEELGKLSSDSTVFHTVSGYIYHPKLYLMAGEAKAVAVVGSANLTRDGLFRNVEFATAIHLSFSSSTDFEVYNRYDGFINELLNTSHPNVQSINASMVQKLKDAGLIKPEAQVKEPGPARISRRSGGSTVEIETLFPPLRVPVAPPAARAPLATSAVARGVVVPPRTVGTAGTFIMQLSPFDCSHRTGVPGTPEVLIPHPAINFFPPLSLAGRKYPDALFDVALNTPTGMERHSYRLWYYEERAKGTKIDEYRLRMNHETIDLTSLGGGDLLVINKLPLGSNPPYEVTVLPQSDPTFPAFLGLCRNVVQGKKWGMV